MSAIMTTFAKILTQLRAERSRIEQAIAVIESLSHSPGRRRGRPAHVASAPKRRRRRMSAAAKRKIAAAQRARWAAWRKRKKAA